MNKNFWTSFFVLSIMSSLRKKSMRVHKVFRQLLWKWWDLFCNTYEVVENTNFRRKGNVSSEENYLTNISRNIEYGKPHGAFCGGAQRLLTIFVQVKRPFHRDLRGFFGKKTVNFPVKKKIWPLISRIIESDKLLGKFCNVQKGKLTITVEVIKQLL